MSETRLYCDPYVDVLCPISTEIDSVGKAKSASFDQCQFVPVRTPLQARSGSNPNSICFRVQLSQFPVPCGCEGGVVGALGFCRGDSLRDFCLGSLSFLNPSSWIPDKVLKWFPLT